MNLHDVDGAIFAAQNAYFVYIVSRAWRLLPVFIVISAATWLSLIWTHRVPTDINLPHQIFSNLFLLGYDGLPQDAQVIDSAWSLDIEMQFYLVAPILIFLLNKRYWPFIIAICIVLAFTTWAGHARLVGQYLIFFGIGAVAAAKVWKPSAAIGWGSLAFTGVLILACVISPWRGILIAGKHPTPIYYAYNLPAEIMLSLVLAPWAIYTTKQKDSPMDSMFGDLSYIVYLVHIQILDAFGSTQGSYPWRAFSTASAYVAMTAFSWVIWRYIDRPINALRSRWVSRQISAHPAVQPAKAVI